MCEVVEAYGTWRDSGGGQEARHYRWGLPTYDQVIAYMPAESMVSAVVVRLIHGVAVFEFVYNKGTLKDLIDALVHTAFLVKTFGVDRVRYRVPYRRSWIRFLERMNVPPRGPAMMDMEHSL